MLDRVRPQPRARIVPLPPREVTSKLRDVRHLRDSIYETVVGAELTRPSATSAAFVNSLLR